VDDSIGQDNLARARDVVNVEAGVRPAAHAAAMKWTKAETRAAVIGSQKTMATTMASGETK